MSVLCCVYHVFPPLVSIFGLFPVLVSCRYEFICVQLCVCDYVLITLCILVLSFEFDLVWSTRYFPVYPVSESCLDVIKDYYLSLSPRLPPSCVHRDRRPDLTVSGAHSPRFVFRFFSKVFVLVPVCLSRGMEVAAHYSRHSPLQVGVGVRRDRRESTGREPSCPPFTGDIRRRRWLSQAHWLVVCFPGCRSPRCAVRGRSRHRPAADSMPTGPPLTQCPPDRR